MEKEVSNDVEKNKESNTSIDVSTRKLELNDRVYCLYEEKVGRRNSFRWYGGKIVSITVESANVLFDDGYSKSQPLNKLCLNVPKDSVYTVYSKLPLTERKKKNVNGKNVNDKNVQHERTPPRAQKEIVHKDVGFIAISHKDTGTLEKHIDSLIITNAFPKSRVVMTKPIQVKNTNGELICPHHENSKDVRCKKIFGKDLQKYNAHLELHRSSTIAGFIAQEVLDQAGSMVCPVCKDLVSVRRKVHDRCRGKHITTPSTIFPLTQPTILSQESKIKLPSLKEIAEVPKFGIMKVPPNSNIVQEMWKEAALHTIDLVLKNNDEHSWTLYYMLPYCTLVGPMRAGKRNGSKKLFIKNVCRRMERWIEGDYLNLWNEATQELCNKRKTTKKDQPSGTNMKIVQERISQNRLSDACKTLASQGIAECCDDTFEKLKTKHPEGPEYDIPTDLPAAASFSYQEVKRAVFTFPRGSAGGIFAWYPDTVKYTLDRDGDTPQNIAYTKLVNLVASGQVPETVRPFLAGASLTALNKDGKDVRPIASGDPLRRVVAKCCCYSILEDVRTLFEPLQQGCSQNGTERIIHTFRNAVDKEDQHTTTKILLKLDMKNAFNSISREAILKEVLEHFPELSRFVYWCYAKHTYLFYANKIILSQLGVQQGDPLGPILFCLALLIVVLKVKENFPTILQQWYCDDGNIIAKPEELARVYNFLIEELKALSLETNFKKTELIPLNPEIDSLKKLIGNNKELKIFNNTLFVSGRNFHTLGAPIGDAQHCAQFVQGKIKGIEHLLKKILTIDNVQASYLLINYCCSFGKMVYYTRTTPTETILEQTKYFDCLIAQAVEKLVNQPLGPTQITQMSLPWKKGGLGLRKAYSHSCAAYVSSLAQCKDLVVEMSGNLANKYIENSLEMLNDNIEEQNRIPSPNAIFNNADYKEQSYLSTMINEKSFMVLLNNAEIEYHAKLMGISAEYASYWLSMIPDYRKGLVFTNTEFSTLLKFWLNLDVFPMTSTHCPMCRTCPTALDSKGVHAICCKSTSDRITKHNNIRDIIFREAEMAAKSPLLEVTGICLENNKRPADILLPNHKDNRNSCLDVGIVNPMAKQYRNKAASDQLSAAVNYEAQKIRKHAEDCRKQGLNYFPICGESTGGWSKTSRRIFKELYTASARRYNIKPHIQKRKFYELLSFHLQKMNATMILRRDKML
jgi:hypothetical protein